MFFGWFRNKKKEDNSMKYLIAGLGNIGPEYHNTRHNIGFSVLDALSEDQEIPMASARYGEIAKYRFKGRTLLLLKPSTYMNLSGNALRYWLNKENIKDENLLVLTDDIALPLGKLRMRKKGSHGGHNGLKHIEEILGHSNYSRVRIGVGNDFGRGQQVEYVLGKWSDSEMKDLEKPIKKAIDMLKGFATMGIDRTMNQYN